MRLRDRRVIFLAVFLGLGGAVGCSDDTSADAASGKNSESDGSGSSADPGTAPRDPGHGGDTASSPGDDVDPGDGDGDTGDGDTSDGDTSDGDSASGDGDSGEAGEAVSSGGEGHEGSEVQPGTLTAGAWDDNRNYEHFVSYLAQTGQLAGRFDFTEAERTAAQQLFAGDRAPNKTLDVSLVIDTTGSMGDEIDYLQAELGAISKSIQASYPNASQRWSLVLYRDQGDDYVVRTFDFDANVDHFRTNLAAQSVDGGGDFPEAPEAAFAEVVKLSWRSDADTARLAFWVADAPHHEESAQKLAAALRATRELDVHVYPVASSGVDELTELTMRSAAQLTGGRYLFLTDDSGVGGAHKEPTIPCYFVTRLDKAIVRMVDVEMSGTYHEPAATDVLRTGGNVQDGACTLASGAMVEAF